MSRTPYESIAGSPENATFHFYWTAEFLRKQDTLGEIGSKYRTKQYANLGYFGKNWLKI